VKFHITSIFTKLNASSRAEAVAIGMRQGLILL
jgi:NarL family two-component system response regulator YdfI